MCEASVLSCNRALTTWGPVRTLNGFRKHVTTVILTEGPLAVQRDLVKSVRVTSLPLFHYSADLVYEQTAEETQRSVGEQPLNLIKQIRDTQTAFTPAQDAAYTLVS